MDPERIHKRAERAARAQLHKRMGWRTVWQIVEQFAGGKMAAGKACEWLGIQKNRLYVLRRRWLAQRGKPESDWLYQRTKTGGRYSSDVRAFIAEELRYLREESEYFKGHYNFAMLAEECQKRFGKRFHRDTLRQWAIREGLYDPKTDKTGKPTIRFETGGIGMLFQHDSSIHAWVPATKRNDVLILTIDDHSRKVVGAILVPHDTSWNHLCLVRSTVELYGCPLAYYTDNHAIFTTSTDIHTQFGRALNALDIAVKLTAKAHPQAKGKVEKRFDYFQRRIPLLCEKYKIPNLTQANKVLKEEVDYFNHWHIHAETHETPEKRWNKAIEEGRTYLRPLDKPEHKLDLIFGLHYPRFVRNDGTISFAGQSWKIPKAPLRKTVTAVLRPPTGRRRPYTELFVLYEGSTLAHFVMPTKSGGPVEPGVTRESPGTMIPGGQTE